MLFGIGPKRPIPSWASRTIRMKVIHLFARSACRLMLLAAAASAQADAIQFGAVTRCEEAGAGFELGAFVQFNEQMTMFTSKHSGTRQLSYGRHTLRCQVGKELVLAEISVNPPSNGQCMGAGFVALVSLTYADRKVWPPTDGSHVPFNWNCTGNEPMLVRIRLLKNASDVFLEQCTAQDWKWESGYTAVKCNTSLIR